LDNKVIDFSFSFEIKAKHQVFKSRSVPHLRPNSKQLLSSTQKFF